MPGRVAPALARASEMAQTALGIDAGIPEVYWVLGYIEAQRRHPQQAIAHLQTALQPGFVMTEWLATYPMTDQGQLNQLTAAFASLDL